MQARLKRHSLGSIRAWRAKENAFSSCEGKAQRVGAHRLWRRPSRIGQWCRQWTACWGRRILPPPPLAACTSTRRSGSEARCYESSTSDLHTVAQLLKVPLSKIPRDTALETQVLRNRTVGRNNERSYNTCTCHLCSAICSAL